jgi:hypothetical protein
MNATSCINQTFDAAEKYKKLQHSFKQIKKAEGIAVNKIITLCGSTDFKYEYARINMLFTLAGNVVLSCGVFREDFSEIEKFRGLLEEIHRKKINMSDIVFVINCNGVIGEHTLLEIEYAGRIHKQIIYLESNGEKSL